MDTEFFKGKVVKASYKKDWQELADHCLSSKEAFFLLMKYFLEGEYRLQQCASNVVAKVHDQAPKLFVDYLPKIIGLLYKQGVSDAVKRNATRLLQTIDLKTLDEENIGLLVNSCFSIVQNNNEAIAIRAFSMTILYNAVMIYPDLKNELRPILLEIIDYGSAGEKSRAQKIMKLQNK